ncbi:glycosyltransferase family 2 protein [Romeria aff. gracilis LEGE 07310]|uniref:Glycosyltransferase family 2 protein n=1 Tax=Vasconcelosia minhoensis LEGE 07310 TaxID=915328 RepID=A0A8J7AXE7_9CYAN|nr:glycosyltransferase family 2 protein [Romeria gracilis]MBE9079248.1 glycosyltransferase family 2 protein [Romeria aff. gracilis LEGE 07310]
MSAPTFSIVITTHNRLALLQRAIASALVQTVPSEIIVADNASTDGTQAYVESLGEQVVYRRNSTNENHAGAVNAGVEVAQGDWVKLVDDDDYLAPNCVEVMQAAIALRPEAAICSCQAAQVDAEETELSRTPVTGPGKIFYIPQSDIHYGMLLEVVPFGTPIQVAFRRSAFLQSGGWDRSMTSCDDIDSWIRIAQHGDALFINECLAYRTVWPGGTDQKIALQRRLNTNILIKERIYERISEQHRPKLPTLASIRQYLHLHWMLVALKQKQISAAIALAFPAVFSPTAWQLLQQAIDFRKQKTSPPIPKKVLTP